MDRIIGLNSNTYHGFTLKETFEGMEKAGFHYVELTATKGWTEHVFPSMSLEELWKIKLSMMERNIIPFALSGHTNLMDHKRLDDFILNIRLAAFFGCDYILSSIGEAHLKDEQVVTKEELVENILSLVAYLEEYELILCLENHGEHGTGKQLKEIVSLVNSDRVKINYDTANAIFYGDVHLEEDLLACIDHIGFVHLKDKAGKQDEWNFPAIGKGDLDLLMVIETLDKNGNPSPVSIEIEFTEKGPKNVEEVHEAVKDSYAYLTDHGYEIL